ncbi:multidrug effflux MFS transporter [Chryseobacterium sp. CT-SW4]|uniref:multidrug effflux MFS transporter n=1 Tax=Chryseobacterium sp. SW-1 TaxID=3157343 RepID=UPI003B01A7E6
MKKFSIIVIILALLNTLESLSIDLYLPAFPSMAKIFNTDIGNIQVSISVFFAGFAIGQLFWGPLSDKKGRKPALYAGILIFIIAAFTIIFTTNYYVLWIMRFIQAFGGSAGIVVGRAIVADLYDKEKAIKIFSSQSQISGIAPIVAPLLGSLFLNLWGWESSFAFLTLLGALTLMMTIGWIPETNKRPHSQNSVIEEHTLYIQIKNIFRNKDFVQNAIIGSIAFASLIIYISGSPFLFMEIHHFSTTAFSLIFALNSVALIIAAYLTPKFLKRVNDRKLLFYAVSLLFIACLTHTIAAFYHWNVVSEIISLYLSIFSIGILFPITTAGALAPFKEGKGIAAALFGFLQLMLTFLLSGAVSLLESDSAMPITVARLSIALIALYMGYLTSKEKKFTFRRAWQQIKSK